MLGISWAIGGRTASVWKAAWARGPSFALVSRARLLPFPFLLQLQPQFFDTCTVTVIKAIDSVCVHFPMAYMGLFFDQEIIVEIEIV
jgi:hypothetical protein